MAGKENNAHQAVNVFRQFAWNLAGTLANVKAGTRVAVRPRRPKPSASR
jgi:hypothetical protein